MIFRFLVPVAVNALLTCLLYYLDRRPVPEWLTRKRKELFAGIFFGCTAALASEIGLDIDGALINVRDAAPITAGLVFGPRAGIIAGVIGGLYRFFSVLWGAGEFTQIACTLSTILSGCIAAVLRKFMFDDKKPGWMYGAGIAVLCEVLHMLMVFLTNMYDAQRAFLVVQQCTVPMILSNAIAVGLALGLISVISGERAAKKKGQVQISQTFSRWLLVCILLAYSITSGYTFIFQSNMATKQTESMLNQTIEDVHSDITDMSDRNLLALTESVRKDYETVRNYGMAYLTRLLERYGVAEINVVDAAGIIVGSTNRDFIGYNMKIGQQASAFMVLIDGEESFVQEYGPTSYDPSIQRKYAGLPLENGGFIQVGYDFQQFRKDLNDSLIIATQNRHVGETGFVFICGEDRSVLTDNEDYMGMDLSELGIGIDPALTEENTVYEAEIYGETYCYAYARSEGFYIIATIPKSEAMFMRDTSIYIAVFMQVLVFGALFVLIYFLIKKVIIDNLRKINASLSQITDGNLDVSVNVRSNEEFASLSDDINTTVDTLKRYIDEAAARIDKELEYAKTIQLSALPSVFPPFPDQDCFDIRASMNAAKEVGGDFYDFYMLGEETVAFLAADVSGKGIPAAMFMMQAKTILKDLAERGLTVNEIFTQANQKLCENNESGMFVTAWMGILDLRTGRLCYANAGHNPPLIKHCSGSFEYLKGRAGFVLAGMDGVRYRMNELMLKPGDRLFLYTDGVTEATDTKQRLYGEDRLLRFMNTYVDDSQERILYKLREDIENFAGSAPQFDDITMVILDVNKLIGGLKMEERTFPAEDAALHDVLGFVEEELEKAQCPMKTVMQLTVALEEVFVNVAHYAYPNGKGQAKLAVGFEERERMLTIRLSDSGVPFDPLAAKSPDITLSAQDREIGGLGIFICKKTMDEITYAYENGENILTMKKKI